VSFPPAKTELLHSAAPTTDYDVVKLCKAIAVAETGGCKDGTARKRMNCHGIMAWDKQGNRYPKYFKSHEESHKECERIWSTYYKRFPDRSLAARWTGNDNADHWLNNVRTAYANL